MCFFLLTLLAAVSQQHAPSGDIPEYKKPAPPKEQAFKTDIAPFKPLRYKRKNQSTTTLRAPLAVTTTYTPFESTGIPAFAPL